jgi:hypothetical protein
MRTDVDRRWRELSDEVLSSMKEWRLQHPRATLRDVEAAIDERLGGLRTRMVEDAALASGAAASDEPAAAPVCRTYGTPLQDRGDHPRELATYGGQIVSLLSQMAMGNKKPGIQPGLIVSFTHWHLLLMNLVVGVLDNKGGSIEIQWYRLASSDGPRPSCSLQHVSFAACSSWRAPSPTGPALTPSSPRTWQRRFSIGREDKTRALPLSHSNR